MNANRDKQRAFKERQREQGLVMVSLWVPAEDKDKISRIASLMREGKQVTGNPDAVTSTRKPTGRAAGYTDAAKQLALSLRAKGATHQEIIKQLKAHCGRSPDKSNLGRAMATWEKQLGSGLGSRYEREH